jgi:hypothetical protein
MLIDESRKTKKTHATTHEPSKKNQKNTEVSRKAYDTKAGQGTDHAFMTVSSFIDKSELWMRVGVERS